LDTCLCYMMKNRYIRERYELRSIFLEGEVIYA